MTGASQGWRRAPACSWMKMDSTGEFRCVYRALGSPAAALEVARFTFFDQRFVDAEVERLNVGYRGQLANVCSPDTCARWLPKFADAVHV